MRLMKIRFLLIAALAAVLVSCGTAQPAKRTAVETCDIENIGTRKFLEEVDYTADTAYTISFVREYMQEYDALCVEKDRAYLDLYGGRADDALVHTLLVGHDDRLDVVLAQDATCIDDLGIRRCADDIGGHDIGNAREHVVDDRRRFDTPTLEHARRLGRKRAQANGQILLRLLTCRRIALGELVFQVCISDGAANGIIVRILVTDDQDGLLNWHIALPSS